MSETVARALCSSCSCTFVLYATELQLVVQLNIRFTLQQVMH